MPKVQDIPENLRPFIFHGVDFRKTTGQAEAECPLCGGSKFFVNSDNGLWDCKNCMEHGNPIEFIRKFHEECLATTTEDALAELAKSRGVLSIETLQRWRVVKSQLTGEWLIPAYNVKQSIVQLYRYVSIKSSSGGWKKVLLPTPTLGSGIFKATDDHVNRSEIFLCEGPWDAMALEEVLRHCKFEDGKYLLTADQDKRLAATVSVLALPGCGNFNEQWASLFAGKEVSILFDSDHPKTNAKTGAEVPPAGYAGALRVNEILAKAEEPPERIWLLQWGPEGYDADKPTGYDLRDALAGPKMLDRVKALPSIIERLEEAPEVDGATLPGRDRSGESNTLPCESWEELLDYWRNAMHWTDGLERGLACILACVTSTPSTGSQLWIKLLGPASSGKSSLCEAISSNRLYVKPKSTITGFHSGYKSDKNGEKDHSLLAELQETPGGMTLVTKDGDTLLKAPNLQQIMGEARDVYDGVSRAHYRHGLSRNAEGMRVTWVLAGTKSLKDGLDHSELGERFLDCVIMEGIQDDEESLVCMRVAQQTRASMGMAPSNAKDSQSNPEQVEANKRTGGYVHWLREEGQDKLRTIEMSDQAMLKCVLLGKFVAYARARPSTVKNAEKAGEREFGARLTSQMIRLAMCLAVVKNKQEVDKEVLQDVAAVALDTAEGATLKMIRYLFRAGDKGYDLKSLCRMAGCKQARGEELLMFLRSIGATDFKREKAKAGAGMSIKWMLTKSMTKLFREATI